LLKYECLIIFTAPASSTIVGVGLDNCLTAETNLSSKPIPESVPEETETMEKSESNLKSNPESHADTQDDAEEVSVSSPYSTGLSVTPRYFPDIFLR
jgi:hypothetical protein